MGPGREARPHPSADGILAGRSQTGSASALPDPAQPGRIATERPTLGEPEATERQSRPIEEGGPRPEHRGGNRHHHLVDAIGRQRLAREVAAAAESDHHMACGFDLREDGADVALTTDQGSGGRAGRGRKFAIG